MCGALRRWVVRRSEGKEDEAKAGEASGDAEGGGGGGTSGGGGSSKKMSAFMKSFKKKVTSSISKAKQAAATKSATIPFLSFLIPARPLFEFLQLDM